MNTLNTGPTTLTAARSQPVAPATFTPPNRSKSLYFAPPRFDTEGWIFITLLTAFTAALAALVLAR